MGKISLADIKQMSPKELTQELASATVELTRARLEVRVRQSKHTARIKSLRKTIARIKTIQRVYTKQS